MIVIGVGPTQAVRTRRSAVDAVDRRGAWRAHGARRSADGIGELLAGRGARRRAGVGDRGLPARLGLVGAVFDRPGRAVVRVAPQLMGGARAGGRERGESTRSTRSRSPGRRCARASRRCRSRGWPGRARDPVAADHRERPGGRAHPADQRAALAPARPLPELRDPGRGAAPRLAYSVARRLAAAEQTARVRIARDAAPRPRSHPRDRRARARDRRPGRRARAPAAGRARLRHADRRQAGRRDRRHRPLRHRRQARAHRRRRTDPRLLRAHRPPPPRPRRQPPAQLRASPLGVTPAASTPPPPPTSPKTSRGQDQRKPSAASNATSPAASTTSSTTPTSLPTTTICLT